MPTSKKRARKKIRTGRRLIDRASEAGGSLQELLDLVRSAPVVVVLIGGVRPAGPDLVLSAFRAMGCVTRWFDARRLDDVLAVVWLAHLHGQRAPASKTVQPGYYLFINGRPCAYQSGLIDFKRDKFEIGVGALAALIGVVGESTRWIRGGAIATSAGAAMRVCSAFMSVIAAHKTEPAETPRASTTMPRSSTTAWRGSPTPSARSAAPPRWAPPPRSAPPPRWAPPPPRPVAAAIDELAVAFETLGLASTATYAAVKARYRDLAKQWHPDRLGDSHTNANEAAMRMTQINVAHSIICAARGW